ncbi:MAG: S8 family serine peptidase [Muribaculaceae bacterium]|nr:S8 family serine peptidase [Muribaculaceae bacterium]
MIQSLKGHGVIVECEFDGFVTAHIPVDRLYEISQIPGVINVEVSRVLEQCTDSTMKVTNVDDVLDGVEHGLPQAYDGSGVIVGIIDSGYDYQHYAFRDPSDPTRSRISRVYDTQNSTGHPARLGSTVLSGSIFMGEQIDTLITDSDGTHGTHTASIAAGTHYKGYGGMAPGADIVLCVSSNYLETEMANCMKYIYAYADSVNKPCVISLSVSVYNGDHDGRSYLSRAVAQLVGPGKVFVIAAGNNAGNVNGYSKYVYGPTTTKHPFNAKLAYRNLELAETDYSFYYRSLWGEIWARERNVIPVLQFHILDKRNRQIVWKSRMLNSFDTIPASEFSDYFEPNSWIDSVGYMMLSKVYINSNSRKYGVRFSVYNLRSKSYTVNQFGAYDSNYQIGLTIFPPSISNPTNSRLVDSCFLDVWISAGENYFALDDRPIPVESLWVEDNSIHTQEIEGYYAVPSDKCTINTFAVNDSLISAGNYAARNSHYSLNRDSVVSNPSIKIGDIYYNSSYEEEGYGPTGKALPTVCAPGVFVVAAGNRYSYFHNPLPDANPDLVLMGPDRSRWGVMTGTSMAAPTVAGIIAQWLQINPNLSPGDIKRIIAATAKKDGFSMSPRFGPNGKIDALAGVRYLLGLPYEPVLGDVNGDGIRSIKDVTWMIDKLLNDDLSIDMKAADVNQDGLFSIKDVTLLIDMLLASV